MISTEDCEFIKKFEKANSEEKQLILTKEGQQVRSSLCTMCLSRICAHCTQPMQYATDRFYSCIQLIKLQLMTCIIQSLGA